MGDDFLKQASHEVWVDTKLSRLALSICEEVLDALDSGHVLSAGFEVRSAVGEVHPLGEDRKQLGIETVNLGA